MTGMMRVLVVDDAPDLRLVVREALEVDGGFTVVGEADDGMKGVELASRLQPDLVVLDLAMPTLDGLSALPHIREVAPEAQIVVLSGLARGPLESQVIAGGAVGFLEKGIPASRFVAEVRTLLGLLDAVDTVLDELRTSLAAHATSASIARRAVLDTLDKWGHEGLREDAALLVSELVTNAVVHGGGKVEVAVLLIADRVRVEVHDHGKGLPVGPDEPDESGRGLLIVDAVASAWGVEAGDDGKRVWFELARPLDERMIR